MAPCPAATPAIPNATPDTGELHAVSYFFGRGNTVRYSIIGVDGHARHTVDVTVTGSPIAGKVRETRLDDHPQEFPRIDERLLGRPHRYGYALQAACGTGAIAVDAVLKHDLYQGRTTVRQLGQHRDLSGASRGVR